MLKVFQSRCVLAYVCLLVGFLFFGVLAVRADKTPVRAVSFQIAVDCSCASCVFDTQRELKKFAGVKSAKFNGKTRRLEMEFEESTHPLSALARLVVKSELGKGAALCWSVPAGRKAENVVKNLGEVPGVQSAKQDKSGLILLIFKDAPTVKLQQLDKATKGAADEN